MNTIPMPAARAEADARNRAARTFVQGFAVTVTAACVTAFVVGMAGGIEWTREYWVTLGLAVANSAILGTVSYLSRKLVPPPGSAP